jgi:DNA-binding LytR/AlgR family response regulator
MKSGLIFHDIKMEIPVKTGVIVRYYGELMYVIYDAPYCWLYFVGKVKYKIEAAMQYVLDNLPESFVRCNRSVILNLCYYKEYRMISSEVVMEDDMVFSLSRLNTHKFNAMRINMPYISLPYTCCYTCEKECENKPIFSRRKNIKHQ